MTKMNRLIAPNTEMIYIQKYTIVRIYHCGPHEGWRSLPAGGQAFEQPQWPEAPETLNASVAFSVAQELRTFVRGAGDAEDDEFRQDHLLNLHNMAGALQQFHDEFQQSALISVAKDVRGVAPGGFGLLSYRTSYLINVLVVCSLLRDSSRLRMAVKYAVALVLPPSMATQIARHVDAEGRAGLHIPDKSTISRARFMLDVALMCFFREYNHRMLAGGGMARYGMLDSSPQGGRDLLLVSVMSIPRDRLPELFICANQLHSFWEDWEGDHADEALLSQERSVMERLHEDLKMHASPVMVIGSGKGDLASKFEAFVFSQYLESKTVQDLASMLGDFTAITSDQGIEYGVGRVIPVRSSALFPWLEEAGGDDDDFMFAPRADGAGVAELGLTGSVSIAGLLHIIHNSSLDLSSAMPSYKDTVHELKHVSNLVRRRDTKQRLLLRCFNSPPACYRKRGIETFKGKCYEDRWATVASCSIDLLGVEDRLRSAWDVRRYGHVEEQEGATDGANVQLVDEAMNDDYFWAMLRVFNFIASMLMQMWSWAESCSCHGHLDWKTASSAMTALWSKCPLRGKRAPCLVNGDFFRYLNDLANTASASLLQALPATLTAAQRAACLHEFELGRAHLVFVFVLRLSHWESDDFLIFGCAHHDPVVGKRWLRRALVCASDQRLYQRLRAGVLYDEANLWLDGEDLTELRVLAGFLGELRFAWTAERHIEGEHARVLTHKQELSSKVVWVELSQ